tara:strand:- start:1724 stop:2608 length:885 start_codon:yes stop_codon:yes gene_type:complete
MNLNKFYRKNMSIYYLFLFCILSVSGYNFSKKDINESELKLSYKQKAYELKNFNYQKNKSSQNKNETTYKDQVRLSTTFKKQGIQNKNFSREISNKDKAKNKFYINLSGGYSDLKNYDVFDVSTNKAIWDDRYTNNGSSIEFGLGRNLGRFRIEISYARENGRLDQYLTYFDGSIINFDPNRGKLHKDFYFLNTYFDFLKNKKLTPFIGIGIGLVNSSQDSAPFIPAYCRQVFANQLKAGMGINASESTIVFLEGFIRNANSHITSDGIGTPYTYEAKKGFDSEGIQIGLRKYF